MEPAEMIGIFMVVMGFVGLGFFFILRKIQKPK
jgi:hypothetical protein